MNRRTFMGVTAASALAAVGTDLDAKVKSIKKVATEPGIHVRFIGTGAADWPSQIEPGKEWRRNASILVEESFLIDLTMMGLDKIPEGCAPDTIFYTHSHSDHHNPEAALKAGVKRVFVNNSWFDIYTANFKQACHKLEVPMPQIIPLCIGCPVEVAGVIVTQLPANHATEYVGEQTVLYLLEKDGARVIYATDTGGIPAYAAKIAGIDAHKKVNPITGLIMEATMGMDHEVDFRIFTHSSVKTVLNTYEVLSKTKALTLPVGLPVYLTHLARTLHGTQAELDATLPTPLRAPYDGEEVLFRPA